MTTSVTERPGKNSDWEAAKSLQAEAVQLKKRLAQVYGLRAEVIKRLDADGVPISMIAEELGITRLPIYRALEREVK